MSEKKTSQGELSLPNIAGHPEAVEALRVWVVPGDGQEFSVRPVWEDPGAWGLLFVDLARHVAYAYEQQGMSGEDTLWRIREMFDAEWNAPTDHSDDVSTQ